MNILSDEVTSVLNRWGFAKWGSDKKSVLCAMGIANRLKCIARVYRNAVQKMVQPIVRPGFVTKADAPSTLIREKLMCAHEKLNVKKNIERETKVAEAQQSVHGKNGSAMMQETLTASELCAAMISGQFNASRKPRGRK